VEGNRIEKLLEELKLPEFLRQITPGTAVFTSVYQGVKHISVVYLFYLV
jgi:hypothetical protein